MKRALALTIVPVLGAMLLSASPASAQPFKNLPFKIKVNFNPVNNKLPVAINKQFPVAAAYHHYHVRYRLPNWKCRTFICHYEAHEFEDLLRSRGYQAYVKHHGGHYHVCYRFTCWKTYRTVDCHEYAHELANYLQSRGYQAKVVHH